MTITEITRAMRAGVDIVKLFPGSQAGAGTVKAIKAPLPQANIMPTGGVNLENMKDWFAAGGMVGPADHDDYDQVTKNAAAYIAELKDIRSK